MIIFTGNITSIQSFPKSQNYMSGYHIARNYKKKIGTRFLVFPRYEVVEEAVLHTPWVTSEYYCDLKDFKSEILYFEDDLLYYKPHCDIRTSDGKSTTKYFETVVELKEWVDELKSQAPHIEI